MTLKEKVAALHRAGFPILYADRQDEKCPQSISWSEVRQSSYPYHGIPVRYYVELSSVAKGEDYYDQSTTLDRSNYRRLREDYPDTFTDTSYSNVDSLGAFIGNLSDDVVQILINLVEQYPAYDDSDMSALEYEETCEQWEEFAADELGRELPEDSREQWENLSSDDKAELFWDVCREIGEYPEHDGRDVRWSAIYKAVIPAITETLARQS